MEQRPVVRVDNYIIFPDGSSRKLKLSERIKLKRGKKISVKLNSGQPTEFI